LPPGQRVFKIAATLENREDSIAMQGTRKVPKERGDLMAELAALTSHQLFKQWRGGDAEAGKAMAQRFSDWYYAITTARLGDENGRGPLERSCVSFQQGIVGVTKASQLVDWAHDIVVKEVDAAGRRNGGGDYPNALTKNQSPTTLIKAAATKLDAAQLELLQKTYNPTTQPQALEAVAAKSGGYPHAIYRARLALKDALQHDAGIVFTTAPSPDNLDWAPLPLYEGGKLSAPLEERAFERWMLADPVVCREVAEFAAFTHALRAGALQGAKAGAAMKGLSKPGLEKVTDRASADGSARVTPTTSQLAKGPPSKSPPATSSRLDQLPRPTKSAQPAAPVQSYPDDDDDLGPPSSRFTAVQLVMAAAGSFVLVVIAIMILFIIIKA
jgi:hypothetical protein